MRALLLALTLSLGSCAIIDNVKELTSTTKELVAQVKQTYDDGKKAFAKAKTEADANKDGTTTVPEWMIWLTSGGGLAFILALIRNGKSNERKAKNEAKVDAQDERLRKLEAVADSAPRAV